ILWRLAGRCLLFVKNLCNPRTSLDSVRRLPVTIRIASARNHRMVHPRSMLATAPPAPLEAPCPALQELQAGLLAPAAHIDPKFLYDTLGSSLFTAITQLPEYYPTRCEAEILRDHEASIARHVGAVDTLIDLGAGDCVNAER